MHPSGVDEKCRNGVTQKKCYYDEKMREGFILSSASESAVLLAPEPKNLALG
jgi:hypothetical protein